MFDFKNNTTVSKEKFESVVPADFQPLYAEDGDVMKLDSSEPWKAAAISALTGSSVALAKARTEITELNKKKDVDLSPLSEYGDSVDTIASGISSAIEEATKAARKGDKSDVERQVAKIKEDLAKGHATELKAKDEVIGGLTGQLKTLLVDNAATKALAEAGAIDADLVLPHIHNHVKAEMGDDGKFSVTVVDAAGDPRYSSTTAAPMQIGELVGEMKAQDKYAPLFRSEKKSGSGTNQQRHTMQRQTQDGDKSSHDKIVAGLEDLNK